MEEARKPLKNGGWLDFRGCWYDSSLAHEQTRPLIVPNWGPWWTTSVPFWPSKRGNMRRMNWKWKNAEWMSSCWCCLLGFLFVCFKRKNTHMFDSETRECFQKLCVFLQSLRSLNLVLGLYNCGRCLQVPSVWFTFSTNRKWLYFLHYVCFIRFVCGFMNQFVETNPRISRHPGLVDSVELHQIRASSSNQDMPTPSPGRHACVGSPQQIFRHPRSRMVNRFVPWKSTEFHHVFSPVGLRVSTIFLSRDLSSCNKKYLKCWLTSRVYQSSPQARHFWYFPN